MSGIVGFILNAAGLATLAVQISDLARGAKKPIASTIVQLVIGSGNDTMGGNVPHVALWSEKGERIGQSNPGKSKTKAGGDSIIVIEHSQAADENETPGYIMLSNYKVDAICIAALYITETHTSTAWYGDYGYKCGMSWGLSKEEIGAERAVPKCVWLDGDGTNGINSQAMSMHIKDMVANSDRLAQYQENPDTMCKSTPRFSFWGDLLPDSRIPIFDPELEYETDSYNGGIGRDKDPQRVLDSDGEFDKSVAMYLGGNSKRSAAGRGLVHKRNRHGSSETIGIKRRSSVLDKLIITSMAAHSAQELCDSETSWGPDTVSTVENLFCDMETKTLYPVCAGTATTSCFDLENESLILPDGTQQHDGIQARSTPKAYNSTMYW